MVWRHPAPSGLAWRLSPTGQAGSIALNEPLAQGLMAVNQPEKMPRLLNVALAVLDIDDGANFAWLMASRGAHRENDTS